MRKIVPVLVITILVAPVGLLLSFLLEHFGLNWWQTPIVNFALSGAVYYGIVSPVLDRYAVWRLKRESHVQNDNDN